MAGRGQAPKPAHLRQRTNRKPGAGVIEAPKRPRLPEIPNPGHRDPETKTLIPIEWHPLTLRSWKNAWKSPMASRWLESDIDGLGRVALLWETYYRGGDAKILAEIRLQEQRFGLSPLDRSRLQWEVERGEEAENKLRKRQQVERPRSSVDPRGILQAVRA